MRKPKSETEVATFNLPSMKTYNGGHSFISELGSIGGVRSASIEQDIMDMPSVDLRNYAIPTGKRTLKVTFKKGSRERIEREVPAVIQKWTAK